MKATLTTFPASRRIERKVPEQAGNLRIAGSDIAEGMRSWELWSLLGWQDIRHRYRRSKIGPFWLTISMALLVGGLGVLYAGLFRQEIGTYLPYLSIGLILWGLTSTLINECCTVFINAEGTIKQIPIAYSAHLYRTAWRNVIILAHNAIIYVAIVPLFGIPIGTEMLLAIPGLAVLLLNLLWIGLALGTLSARFRDVPQIVSSALQLVFFLTPIMWQADLVPDRAFLVNANPFYHLFEIVRAPLLGNVASAESWIVSAGLTVAGWAGALAIFGRYRRRIAYWL